MQANQIPAKFPIPFANNAGVGLINPIPQNSQIGITGGAASLFDGFPPLCFLPTNAGGVPPWGRDFNGLLNQSTAWDRWYQAGGPVQWDSTFSTQIGGYGQGALVASTVTLNLWWLSLVDNNTSNPDTGGANWYPCSFAPSIIGSSRQLVGSAPGGTKTASWTIQELIAGTGTALGGAGYLGTGLSLSFNGATTGAGGMDTGSTPTSADLNIYAIYNPIVGAGWSTLGTIACNGLLYTGSHLPAGYTAAQTATTLLWSGKTDGSGNVRIFSQNDRTIQVSGSGALTASGAAYNHITIDLTGGKNVAPPSMTSYSVSSVVPANAQQAGGISSPFNSVLGVAGTTTGVNVFVMGSTAVQTYYNWFIPISSQLIYAYSSSGATTVDTWITSYGI